MNSPWHFRQLGFCAYNLPLSSLSTLPSTTISSPLLCTLEGFRWYGFLQAADCWNSAGERSSFPGPGGWVVGRAWDNVCSHRPPGLALRGPVVGWLGRAWDIRVLIKM
ncbi:hypothetical protein ANOM_007272, partial [Aspergillus nomiae NRRL 13137]